MHTPDNLLVVCLDINKTSLASGLVNSKINKRKNMLIRNFNMKYTHELLNHLHLLSAKHNTTFDSSILFQHPSPNINDDFKLACHSCVQALVHSKVTDVLFVFDYMENKNCFSWDTLLSCLPVTHGDVVRVSSEKTYHGSLIEQWCFILLSRH